jgi:hypothetical protein
VRLRPLGMPATVGQLYQPRMMNEHAGVGGVRIGRGKEVLGENLHQLHFFATKFTWPHLRLKPGHCGGKATNVLNYGTVSWNRNLVSQSDSCLGMGQFSPLFTLSRVWGDYRWGMDWILGLLTTFHTHLITISDTALSLIYKLYSSSLHTLGYSIFTSRILATDFDSLTVTKRSNIYCTAAHMKSSFHSLIFSSQLHVLILN